MFSQLRRFKRSQRAQLFRQSLAVRGQIEFFMRSGSFLRTSHTLLDSLRTASPLRARKLAIFWPDHRPVESELRVRNDCAPPNSLYSLATIWRWRKSPAGRGACARQANRGERQAMSARRFPRNSLCFGFRRWTLASACTGHQTYSCSNDQRTVSQRGVAIRSFLSI